jgi:hypothetical protein
MALPRFENALGVVDGINLTFYTPTFPYRSNSLVVFFNGQLKRADLLDGWVETNNFTGRFDLYIAPLDTDVLQVFYIDESAPLTTSVEVTPMRGTLREVFSVKGLLADKDAFFGVVASPTLLQGEISENVYYVGITRERTSLVGTLQDC